MAQQSSRLHRLLTLLDTGSTQATRFTAARQLGDIAKSYPQDLNSLLCKVSQYLRSKNWDTRVAAAHAIGAIAESVKHTSLTDLCTCVETKMSEEGIPGFAEDVVAWPNFHPNFVVGASFRSYDLSKVLEFGALLASGGQEYDIASDNTKNPRERLARQKQNLRRRLGLDVCEQFMDVNDMIRDEDLIVNKLNSPLNGIAPQHNTSRSVCNVQQLVTNMVPSFKSRRPSARELNLLKRKAKINLKDQTKVWSKDADTDEQHSQEVASPMGFGPDISTSNKVLSDAITDEEGTEDDGDEVWPFHSFVEQLILDMFDPVWEVRHGSVMALREILTHQGASVGVFMSDMSGNFALLSESKDKGNTSTLKREREIDLNLQVPTEEPEMILKRPKLEHSSSQRIDGMISTSSNGAFEASIKVEASELNLPAQQANGELNISSVKVEFQSCLDSVGYLSNETVDMTEAKSSAEDKDAMGKTDILKNIPENCELMKLVKLARHSWLKNSEFLQDCAIRFLCVLSLDRFGDYVSDQVVAPVRETCAQALGAVLKYMHPKLVHETLNLLLQMQRRPEWEVRHGSLLGIKYLVAVRQEMLHDLLDCVLPACKAGLEDPDDDVRAVAADALIPTAAAITSLKGRTLHSIVMLLWDILLELDDLSPSTSSVMNLLAEIYSQDEMMFEALISKEKQEFDLNEAVCVDDTGEGMSSDESPYMLSTLAPRLWPFMRHSITSVRYSAIRTLERLLEAGYRKSISDSSCSFWPSSILGDTLRIVFQNLLLESNDEILECSERVWRLLLQCPVEDLDAAAKTYISSWIELAAAPYGSPMDATKMFWPVAIPRKSHFKAAAKMRAVRLEIDISRNIALGSAEGTIPQEKSGDAATNPVKIIVGADMEMSVTHTRVVTATALGILASKLYEISTEYIVDPLWKTVTSTSGVQRQVASMVLISWFKELKSRSLSEIMGVKPGLSSNLKNWLLGLLACADPAFPTKDSLLPYAELSRTYAKMRNEASQLFSAVESCGMFKDFLSSIKFDLQSLTADDAINFASKVPLLSSNDNAGEDAAGRHIADELESLKQRLLTTSGYLKCVQSNLHVTVCALVAAAVVHMSDLPVKLNPIILPLMASIKREQEEILQNKAAEALAELIYHCIARKPSPNDKLIKNLCNLTCMDPRETPQAGLLSSTEIIEDQDLMGTSTSKHKSKAHSASGEDRSKVEGFISRRGSELALKHLCEKFGSELFDKLPKLWDCLTEILKPSSLEGLTAADDEHIAQAIDYINDPQVLINNIQVVRSISPLLDESLRPKLLTLLPCIFRCIRHSHVAVRLAASRCITSMAKSMTVNMMGAIIENVIPMLGDMTSVHARQGAGMLVTLLVPGLGVELVPYASLLVVPLLRCMSDCDHTVRQSVTHSFAALVPLLPLAKGLSPPVSLNEGLSRNKEDATFLEQLVDNSHIEDYKLSTELKVTLRRYQQEGINWLAFLKRFNLHGILCDDMGLGKTLQASAIVASDIAEHRGADDSDRPSSSLIICPSTLVGHWVFEIEKFIEASVITALQYVGSVQDRISLRSQFDKHNVIVTSYDVVRKDIDHLRHILWNYCILDEGHIIKNSKSKITGAVKQLKAQHRLILSGTPIQNNVLDLWSLFDFLMPGFLGTDRQFQATYGKPLLAARDSKCSAKDAEAGALAMEALHKQVMPFLLRRTKDEVLSDLPEKIIQDRYCDLSPVQLKLYEQFSGSQVRHEISSMVKVNEVDPGKGIGSSKASSHVFQALQFLLKLCSHPLLVIGEKSPDSLLRLLQDNFPAGSDIVSELHKLHHSPKLVALQQILEECGIGVEASNSEGSVSVGQHRVLIFAQHKALLDVIEKDLFHVHMKNVTYLRLDGSVEPEKRFDIVKAFNSDPTIDALLLTTHVGGLGLNLTSADTLVFMEHDWNPMRDHQAMDRAHRLGQRKVVNVHRLIMRGTLEEKVMSLQKFKLSVANAIINADNASLKTMNTDQLLDLFTSTDSKKGATAAKASDDENFDSEPKLPSGGKGLKAILGGLEELWVEMPRTALVWALTHVVQNGDCVNLLVVIPVLSSSKKLWGFSRFSSVSSDYTSGHWRSLSGKMSDHKDDIADSCSDMVLQLRDVYDIDKIKIKVKVVCGSPSGVVAAEAKKVQTHWVILDKQLKKEVKLCTEQLECNLVVMKKSQPKVLRLNLVGSPKMETEVLSGSDSSTEHTKNESALWNATRVPNVTPASSPEHSSFTTTTAGTLSISSLDLSTSPSAISNINWDLKKEGLLFAVGNHGLDGSDSDTDSEKLSSPSTSSCSQPWTQDVLSSSGELLKYLVENSQISNGEALNLMSEALRGKFAELDQDHEINVLADRRNQDSNKNLRQMISFTRNALAEPPPLCSICQHKAPIFGKPPQWFTYAELEHATDEFSEANFLAEGGFGSVHRGVLPDGQVIAVKQHKPASSQGDHEFFAEVEVLSCAQHRNVVMLIGLCVDNRRRLLVYEYICNRSLDHHLYGRNKDALEWSARRKIAVGTARGLRYLHEECRVGCIVHRDMRPNNILLTHDFEPLVGDFGLARWQPEGDMGFETRIIGTFGYLAPEYAQTGEVTEKADVYSFGVILVELITGRRAIDLNRPKGQQCLTEWVRPLLEENATGELIDPRLRNCYSEQEIYCMVNCASLCIQRDPHSRPRMSQVLRMLEGDNFMN